MKKLLVVSLLMIAAIFFACRESPEEMPEITLPLKISAAIKGTDGIFEINLTENNASITFEEGHALNGTRLYFDENGGTAEIAGVSKKVPPEIFPAQYSLIKALRAINSTTAEAIKTEQGFKYAIDEMIILVYYDEDIKKITNIKTEENERHFEFVVVALEPYEEQSNGAGLS